MNLSSEPFVIERDFCPFFPSNNPTLNNENAASYSSLTISKHMFENCDYSRCSQPRLRKVKFFKKKKLVLADLFVRYNKFEHSYEKSKIYKAPDAIEIPKELLLK